jgi:hypothetical protein
MKAVRIILALVLTALILYIIYSLYYARILKKQDDFVVFMPLFWHFLKWWSWHPTHFRPIDFIIGIVHVFMYVFLLIGGFIADVLLITLPLAVGAIVGLLFSLIAWNIKAFSVGFFLTAIGWHGYLLFSLLYSAILPFIFSLFGSSLEYSVGFFGFKYYKYRKSKEEATSVKPKGASLEDLNELEGAMSTNRKEGLENKQDEILAEIARYQVLYPEILDDSKIGNEVRGLLTDPRLKSTYDGYIAEATKRFAYKQHIKTMKLRHEALSQIRLLCTELTEVHRAIADLSEAAYESEIARVRNRVREKRLRVGQVEKDIEREEELKSKKLDLEEAELDAKIQQERNKVEKSTIELEAMKKGFAGKEGDRDKGLSPAERNLQSTKDKIDMMKAKSQSLDLIKKAMDEDLASTTDEKLKEEKKRIWRSFYMEKMEE